MYIVFSVIEFHFRYLHDKEKRSIKSIFSREMRYFYASCRGSKWLNSFLPKNEHSLWNETFKKLLRLLIDFIQDFPNEFILNTLRWTWFSQSFILSPHILWHWKRESVKNTLSRKLKNFYVSCKCQELRFQFLPKIEDSLEKIPFKKSLRKPLKSLRKNSSKFFLWNSLIKLLWNSLIKVLWNSLINFLNFFFFLWFCLPQKSGSVSPPRPHFRTTFFCTKTKKIAYFPLVIKMFFKKVHIFGPKV